MKVPSNIIVKSQYTQGKEFIYSDTYEMYQGYYYEMNSRYFIGRTFDPNAREILKLQSDKVDKLRLNSKLSTFISLLKTKLPNAGINYKQDVMLIKDSCRDMWKQVEKLPENLNNMNLE
jgi:hypothetical protein